MSEVKHWAMIDSNNLVINIIDWDGESDWSPPQGTTIIDLTNYEIAPSIGWTYENGAFVPPPPPPEPTPVVNDQS
jgi:hypothetical protein